MARVPLETLVAPCANPLKGDSVESDTTDGCGATLKTTASLMARVPLETLALLATLMNNSDGTKVTASFDNQDQCCRRHQNSAEQCSLSATNVTGAVYDDALKEPLSLCPAASSQTGHITITTLVTPSTLAHHRFLVHRRSLKRQRNGQQDTN